MATLGREESFLMGTCTHPTVGAAPGHRGWTPYQDGQPDHRGPNGHANSWPCSVEDQLTCVEVATGHLAPHSRGFGQPASPRGGWSLRGRAQSLEWSCGKEVPLLP